MNFQAVLLSYFALACVVLSEQCSKEYPFQYYLGTRTPYRLVSNSTFNKIKYEDCKANKAWIVVRHGTRNPSTSNIENIQKQLPKIQELILDNKNFPNDVVKNRDLDLFRKWKSKLDMKDETKLTHEGEEEMLLLAERMQNRFPDVFDDVYSNTTYKFKYTHSQRTKKSAFYFAAGLFGKHTAKDVSFPEPLKNDPILRFYKLCKKWRNEIKSNEKVNGEYIKFTNGPYTTNMVKDFNQRLKLNKELNFFDIYTMYVACGFETAWNKQSKSPWCSLFTKEDLLILEYLEDLKYYWIDGYGHELTYKQACPAIGDMINHLNSSEQFPKVVAYFTHSGTLLKLLAHLGLYKDTEPLTADNFHKMNDRKWKTSLIDSFGTNLAFITFNCNNGHKILALHQENIVRLPPCADTDLCDFNYFMDYYSGSIESCDFNSMCDNTST
ncbi:multiple inositol polyphosphate phosphatase 2 [Rhynchophorus ferrugineus]|uniref:multiple inositol polyphosphate phosphatase 2 n=1 Tax=Rhynchophorus ferrugineus TaxID=354439 RepID=UPI003FCD538B